MQKRFLLATLIVALASITAGVLFSANANAATKTKGATASSHNCVVIEGTKGFTWAGNPYTLESCWVGIRGKLFNAATGNNNTAPTASNAQFKKIGNVPTSEVWTVCQIKGRSLDPKGVTIPNTNVYWVRVLALLDTKKTAWGWMPAVEFTQDLSSDGRISSLDSCKNPVAK